MDLSPQTPGFLRQWAASTSGAAAAGILFTGAFVAAQSSMSFWVSVGLLLPFAWSVASAIGFWVTLLRAAHQQLPLSALLSSKQRRWRAALSGPSILLAWLLVGQLTVRLLSSFNERAVDGGVLLATSALGVFTFLAWGVDKLAALLACRYPAPSIRLGLISLLIVTPALGVLLIGQGTTSGVGSPLDLFGVFKRDELNLFPAYYLLVCALLAYGGASFFLRTQSRSLALVAFFGGVIVSGFGLNQAWKMSEKTSLQVERHGGLALISLNSFRQGTDGDGDGFSAHFAGGDCDDSRKDVYPGAVDVPENGIDEDCTGEDRVALELAKENSQPAPPEAQKELPHDANFLLLTIDTLRYDLGYARSLEARLKDAPKLSPQLDKLAARSIVFQNAYSLASYTSKSVPPMLLGRYASETDRTFEHFDRFSRAVPFVQERLQKAGIRTASVQGYWYFYFKSYGLERGWDVLDSQAAPKQVLIEGDKSSNGDKLADRAIEQLRALSTGPERFFLWTHWVDPHAEYVDHENFDYGPESRQRYDGEVSFVDAQVGRVIAALEELSLTENTIVLVTSDHGEAFGEHKMIRHGFELWEELVRVPLILHVPGADARVIRERRSLIDVTATVLDTFGQSFGEEGELFVRGRSLHRDALAPAEALVDQRPLLVDMPQGPHNRERRAFYQGDLKLVTSNGRPIGLFDLTKDPGELKDLSEDAALLAPIRRAMEAYLAGLVPLKARK